MLRTIAALCIAGIFAAVGYLLYTNMSGKGATLDENYLEKDGTYMDTLSMGQVKKMAEELALSGLGATEANGQLGGVYKDFYFACLKDTYYRDDTYKSMKISQAGEMCTDFAKDKYHIR